MMFIYSFLILILTLAIYIILYLLILMLIKLDNLSFIEQSLLINLSFFHYN